MTKPFDLTGWTSYQQRFLREPPLSLRYVRGWRAPCKSGVFPLGERHTWLSLQPVRIGTAIIAASCPILAVWEGQVLAGYPRCPPQQPRWLTGTSNGGEPTLLGRLESNYLIII